MDAASDEPRQVTSTEKVLVQLEHLANMPDEDLSSLPVPAPTARLLLAAASQKVPTDHQELDVLLERGARALLQLRSDQAPLLVVVVPTTSPEKEAEA